MADQSSVPLPETTNEKPKRKYTTISISHEIKKDLESIIYSSGKAQRYDDLLREMITLKKEKLEKKTEASL